MRITLAGVPRLVNVFEHPGQPDEDSRGRHRARQLRAIRIDFDVPACDHAALGRALHRTHELPVYDDASTGWQATSMSSVLLDDKDDTRRFTVELIEV